MVTIKRWSNPKSRTGKRLFSPVTGKPVSQRKPLQRPTQTTREKVQAELDRRSKEQAQRKAQEQAKIEQERIEATIEKKEEFKKQLSKAQQGPEWEVQPAPSFRQKLRESTKEKGYVTGTLDTLQGGLSAMIWQGQTRAVKKYGGRYNPQFAEFQAGAVRFGTYFTPAGPVILGAEGVEGLTSKEGRRTISQRKEALKEKGFSDPLASTLSVAPEIAQIGAAAIPVSRAIKTKAKTRAIKTSQTRFVSQVGDDEVKVIAETAIGKESRYTALRGKPKDDLLISQGVVVKKGQPQLTQLGKIKPTKPEVTKVRAISSGKDFGSASVVRSQGGFGVKGQPARGVGSAGYVQVEGQALKPTLSFGRVSQVEGQGFSTFVGGKAKTLRLYGKGKLSVIPEQNVRGIIFRQPSPSKTTVFTSAPTKQVTQQVAEQVTAVSEAVKASELAKLPKTRGFGIPIVSALPEPTRKPSQKSQVITKQRDDIFQPTARNIQEPTVRQEPLSSSLLATGVASSTRQRRKTKQKTRQKQDSLTKQLTQTAQTQLQRQQQRQRQQQKQQQVYKQVPLDIIPTPTPITPKGLIYPFKFGLELPRKTKRKRKARRQNIFQPTGYTPSFSATAFGITSRVAPQKLLSGYGPGIRPIIRGKKRKQRRSIFGF